MKCLNMIKSGSTVSEVARYFVKYIRTYDIDFKNYMKIIRKSERLVKFETYRNLKILKLDITSFIHGKNRYVATLIMKMATETIIREIVCLIICVNIFILSFNFIKCINYLNEEKKLRFKLS